MKRLTQWIEEDRAIPRVDIRRGGYEKCAMQLARYEDTGLEPDVDQHIIICHFQRNK